MHNALEIVNHNYTEMEQKAISHLQDFLKDNQIWDAKLSFNHGGISVTFYITEEKNPRRSKQDGKLRLRVEECELIGLIVGQLSEKLNLIAKRTPWTPVTQKAKNYSLHYWLQYPAQPQG